MGTGDIDDTATVKLEAEYKLGKLNPFVAVQQYLGGTDGIQGETGVESFFSLGRNPRFSRSILIKISAEYSNENHISGYFGVSEQQSLNSGIQRYTPGAEFSAVNTQFSFIYRLRNVGLQPLASNIHKLLATPQIDLLY